jgi:TPR repeat protein
MKKVFFSTILFGILSTQVHADYLPSQQSTSALAARYSTMSFNELLNEAKAGQAAAQFYVATRYQYGREVSKDPKQAFTWYKKAADQGFLQLNSMSAVCWLKALVPVKMKN